MTTKARQAPSAEGILEALTWDGGPHRGPIPDAWPYVHGIRQIAAFHKTTQVKARGWVADMVDSFPRDTPAPFELMQSMSNGWLTVVLRRYEGTGRYRGEWRDLGSVGYDMADTGTEYPRVDGNGFGEPRDSGKSWKWAKDRPMPPEDSQFLVPGDNLRSLIEDAKYRRAAWQVEHEASKLVGEAGFEFAHGDAVAYVRGLLSAAGVNLRRQRLYPPVEFGAVSGHTIMQITVRDSDIDRLAAVLKRLGIAPDHTK